MPKQFTTVRLPPDQIEGLRQAAADAGMNYSEALRACLAIGLCVAALYGLRKLQDRQTAAAAAARNAEFADKLEASIAESSSDRARARRGSSKPSAAPSRPRAAGLQVGLTASRARNASQLPFGWGAL